jgi:spore coat protein U-like protein
MRLISLCALFMIWMLCAPAQAGIACSASGTMQFGVFNVLTGTASSVQPATISVSCSGASPNATSATVCVSLGSGQSTQWPPRELINGANKLRFEIYKDAALTSVMGAWSAQVSAYSAGTTGLTLQIPLSGGAGSTSFTLYGVILAAQKTTPPGSYTNVFSDTSSSLDYFQNINQQTLPTCDTTTGAVKSRSLSFTASATIDQNCSISATNLNFGTISSFLNPVDASSTLSVTCSATLPYTVSLSGGLTNASDPTQRKMKSSSNDVLTYGLYRDALRALPWGSTTSINTFSGTGTASTQILNVYGRVSSGQNVPPGTFSDTISATVTY